MSRPRTDFTATLEISSSFYDVGDPHAFGKKWSEGLTKFLGTVLVANGFGGIALKTVTHKEFFGPYYIEWQYDEGREWWRIMKSHRLGRLYAEEVGTATTEADATLMARTFYERDQCSSS